MALPVATIDAQTVASILTEIAETASETLELQDVFGRIAASVRRAIPLDHMGIVRIVDGSAIKQASTFGTWAAWKDGQMEASPEPEPGCSACMHPCSLDIWSPRIRPRPSPIPRVNDTRAELDPSFEGDARILASGARATMWEPFRTDKGFVGGVWVSAFEPRAFTDEHQEILRPIAALLGTAVEHWRIWDAERRRQRRFDQVDAMLATLAGSTDVREVFESLSTQMRAILPHDMMCLTKLDMKSRTIRIVASASGEGIEPPAEACPLTAEELERRPEVEIIHDIPAELTSGTERQRLIVSSGMRSWVRVPVVFSSGEIKGGLSFFHREPSRYDREDAEVARRLADRIALIVSLRELAREAQAAAEAEERAERLAATVETLARELESRRPGRIVGVSRSWREVLVQVGRVAPAETTVLISGESGTGKEVVSSLVHQGSPRAGKPFIAINCAALPEQLLESELFGHERGAFTGASATKIGRLEQAAGGTLFLDEIAEMSPTVQAKFLRVLEQREFQRLGGTRTLKADVRVVAATNRDLPAAIAHGAFREDLFYRLNVFQIHVPALRQRPEDILPLAQAFLEDLGRTMGRPAAGISRDAREWLLAHAWPGNVRELRNAIERAILLCDGGLITREHLPAPMALREAPAAAGNGHAAAFMHDGVDLAAMERSLVEKALADSKGNKSRAARLLGITRAQLYSRLDRHGLR